MPGREVGGGMDVRAIWPDGRDGQGDDGGEWWDLGIGDVVGS